MASLLDRFKNFVSKNAQKTHLDFNRAIYNYLGDTLVWNPDNDDTYINKGYRYNATIYSIINLITKSATNVPFQVYEVQKDNDLKRYKALTSGDFNSNTIMQAKMLQKKALVELHDTDLHELLERPNPSQSYNSWIQEIVAFGKLTGNRYIYGIAPNTGLGAGKFQELYVLPSQKVEINSGGIMEPVKEYSLQYNGTIKIPAEFICHIKDQNLYYDGTGSHLYGMSPLKAGLRVMDANNQALTTGVKYLQNQTARGVLMSEDGDINEVQARALKEKFRQQYQGSDNAGDVIITPKKLSWINFGLNASDLSLIEQYNATIKDLCNIYNVPVQLLNNTDSTTYNNMKEAKKALYQNAVIPELNKIRDELNRWLAPKFGDKLFIDFDYTVIPELQEETEKVVSQMSQAWWITPNEKREAMNYGRDEDNADLDKYYVPSNLLPVGDELIPIPEPKSFELNYTELFKTAVLNTTDTYTTIEEAKQRAIEMGGSGYHPHLFNGSTVFMPFDSHEEYEAAKNNRLEEYYTSQRQEQGFNEPIDYNSIETKEETYKDYPQGATNNARRMIEWREKYGDDVKGGTSIGWSRAADLAARRPLSLSVVKRVHSFLSRHEDNAKIDPKYKDEPWKDAGYVAYNLWGGAAMVAWAKRISENEG